MKTLASFFVLGTVVLACSSTDNTSSSSSGGADPPNTVTIQDYAFTPKEITVKVGDTVHWKWLSGTHSVQSGKNCMPDSNFSSGKAVSGGTFDFKFEKAGTFDYYCDPHCLTQGMTAKVIVQ